MRKKIDAAIVLKYLSLKRPNICMILFNSYIYKRRILRPLEEKELTKYLCVPNSKVRFGTNIYDAFCTIPETAKDC